MEEKVIKPTFAQLWQDVKKHRGLYYRVLPITFVVAAILTLSVPNYYQCTVMLAPEIPGGNKSSGGLASLASNFGINLNSANNGVDAIMPTLYPDLMNSVTFRTSLFPVKVQREDDDASMTYYDYLKDHQRSPWWSYVMKVPGQLIGWTMSLFSANEAEKGGKVNPFRLTKEQMGIVKVMAQKVVCDVDKKTMVITIDVTDQDPLVAATIADSVQVRLQDFITDYRTRKARIDLAFSQKLYQEAKDRYEKARLKSASFNDANQHVFLDRVRSEQIKWSNEMNLQYQNYAQVASQLRMAEAKVQEETPAFTLLQPATVPITKAGPARGKICLILLFLAFFAVTAWAIHREGHLLPFFNSGDDDDTDYYNNDDLLRVLAKLTSTNQQSQGEKSTTPNPPCNV